MVLGCRLLASNSVPAARLMQSWGPAIAVLYTYLFRPYQMVRSRRLNVPARQNLPRRVG